MKKLSFLLILLFAGTTLFASPDKKTGILVLAHGGDSLWNATVSNAVAPLRADYQVAIAFGMANPVTMQNGIDKLEGRGVDTIVVIQLFASSYSVIIRQNEYLLGFRKVLADPPMLMMHHAKGNSTSSRASHKSKSMGGNAMHGMSGHKEKKTLQPLDIEAKILLTKPLNDAPQIASILIDRVKQLSTTPKKETVILVAHGPNDENDNRKWLATLHQISDQIQSAFGTHHFRDVKYLTLRDDASKDIYNAAKQQLRTFVQQADTSEGRALIVPVLLSKGGIEKRIQKRLQGLDYVWKGNTLLPDKRITRFMEESVEQALAQMELVRNEQKTTVNYQADRK